MELRVTISQKVVDTLLSMCRERRCASLAQFHRELLETAAAEHVRRKLPVGNGDGGAHARPARKIRTPDSRAVRINAALTQKILHSILLDLPNAEIAAKFQVCIETVRSIERRYKGNFHVPHGPTGVRHAVGPALRVVAR